MNAAFWEKIQSLDRNEWIEWNLKNNVGEPSRKGYLGSHFLLASVEIFGEAGIKRSFKKRRN